MNTITKKGIAVAVFSLILAGAVALAPHSASASVFSDFVNFLTGTNSNGPSPVAADKPVVSNVSITRGTIVTNTEGLIRQQTFSIVYSITAPNSPVYISKDPSLAVSSILNASASSRVTPVSIVDDNTNGDGSTYFYIAPGQTKTFTLSYFTSADATPRSPGAVASQTAYGVKTCTTDLSACSQVFMFTAAITAGDSAIYIPSYSAYAAFATSTANPSGMKITALNITDDNTNGDTPSFFYIAPGQTKLITATYQVTAPGSNAGTLQISGIKYATTPLGLANNTISSPQITNGLRAILFH